MKHKIDRLLELYINKSVEILFITLMIETIIIFICFIPVSFNTYKQDIKTSIVTDTVMKDIIYFYDSEDSKYVYQIIGENKYIFSDKKINTSNNKSFKLKAIVHNLYIELPHYDDRSSYTLPTLCSPSVEQGCLDVFYEIPLFDYKENTLYSLDNYTSIIQKLYDYYAGYNRFKILFSIIPSYIATTCIWLLISNKLDEEDYE